MRYAILADVHSNLTALDAVLSDIEDCGGVDEVWCLGDIVGYGPDPCECVSRVRQVARVSVMGNHDAAAIGTLDLAAFNPQAATASRWTAARLGTEDAGYLAQLPLRARKEDFTLVHGSPRDPIWEYLLSAAAAGENLPHFTTTHCLVGHTHVPAVFVCDAEGGCNGSLLRPGSPVPLPGKGRLIVNPGAVGQPRDGDPRASYALYDSQAGLLELHRVPYDIRATQARMVEHGLPRALVARLSRGL